MSRGMYLVSSAIITLAGRDDDPGVPDNIIGPNGLLATKARILVTNSIAFIHQFDSLAFIRRGIILESGTYESLMQNPEAEIYKLVYVPFRVPCIPN